MTFNPLIPQGEPSPASQVTPIQINFSQFASVFATNHIALNSNKQGYHGTVTLNLQSKVPNVDQNEVVLYSKNASSNVGTQPQLFIRIPEFLNKGNPRNPPMQLTYNQVNTSGPVYQSFLSGGYLLYFGQTTIINPATSIVITVSPIGTKLLTAQAYANVTTSGGNRNISTQITSKSTFTIFINSPSVPVPITWMAIATV